MDPSIQRGILLCRRLLEPGDEVIPVLFLLQTSECHLGAGDVLFGVLEIFEESILFPYNTLVNVGGCVREALTLASFSSKEAMQVGAYFMRPSSFYGVALGTASFEKGRALSRVTSREAHYLSLKVVNGKLFERRCYGYVMWKRRVYQLFQ